MKRIILCVVCVSTIIYAEPSVYGSGGVSNNANTKKVALLKRKVSQLKERLDGLMSIVEGLSASVHKLEHNKTPLISSSKVSNTNELLEDLGIMIDDINSKYISRDELNKILALKGMPGTVNVPSVKKEPESKEELPTQDTAKIYSQGVRLFVKQRYDEAVKKFVVTDTKGYKPAASNYYLGEISYYTKKYEDAIFYFKKSAGLYDKASYIDTLLLHTAIALEKTGDKAQAKAFYENIVENYKGKKAADIAKEKLRKL